jgi:hypothetical protein
MNKEQMQKIAGIKSEIVVKPSKAIPKTITLTFDTMWLLKQLNADAEIFSMNLKPVEDIDFRALQTELQEDLEIQMTNDYFRDLIDGGGLEDFLIENED